MNDIEPKLNKNFIFERRKNSAVILIIVKAFWAVLNQIPAVRDRWPPVISNAVNSCDLFLFILVNCMKELDYCKIFEENFNFVTQDIMERTWLKTLMVFPKPWVKYSMKFLRFFSFLYQFIDSKKKTRGQLIQSTNIKYKLWKSQNYLYDHYHLISRTKTYTKWTKRSINTHQVS